MYNTKVNKSKTDHGICDNKENTITALIGYCIDYGEID